MSSGFCKEGRDGLAGHCRRGRNEGIVNEGFREMRHKPQDGGGGAKGTRTAKEQTKQSGVKRVAGTTIWQTQTAQGSITA